MVVPSLHVMAGILFNSAFSQLMKKGWKVNPKSFVNLKSTMGEGCQPKAVWLNACLNGWVFRPVICCSLFCFLVVVHAVGSQNSSDAVRPEELADSLLNLVNSDNSFKAAQPLYGSMSKIDSNHRVMRACVWVGVTEMIQDCQNGESTF